MLTTPGAFQTTHAGATDDAFVAKISTSAGPPDTTPPVTTITSGPAGGSTVTSASVTFTFSADETVDLPVRLRRRLVRPLQSPGPGTSGSDTRTLANGSHTFQVRATDTAGNPDTTPESRTFTVNVSTTPPPPAGDTTPPETTITKAPPKTVKTKKRATVELQFSASEAATFACSVDGGSFSACTSPAKFTLKPGKHTLAVVATDSAGNKDASPATSSVNVKKKKKKKHGGKH